MMHLFYFEIGFHKNTYLYLFIRHSSFKNYLSLMERNKNLMEIVEILKELTWHFNVAVFELYWVRRFAPTSPISEKKLHK